MLPCDKETLVASQAALREKVKLVRNDDSVEIEVEGKQRIYKVVFAAGAQTAHITVSEKGQMILDNELSREAIKRRERVGGGR
jgi:hypothetical protein